MVYTVVIVSHVFLAVCLIILVLVQRGKGADMGSGFGAGASGTVFGSRGTTSFFSRTTAVLAALFFFTSLGLAYLGGQKSEPESIVDQEATEIVDVLPDEPVDTAPDETPLELPDLPAEDPVGPPADNES